MDLRGDERLNLTVTYSVHEVCMRGTSATSLRGQFFWVDTDFVQLSQFRFEEYFLLMGWLQIMTLKDPIYPQLVWAFNSIALVHVGGPVKPEKISIFLRNGKMVISMEIMKFI